MSDLYWLTDEQMERLRPHFPKSHGRPRVDDRRVLSGIIFVNRNGLRWRDAPAAYGPHKGTDTLSWHGRRSPLPDPVVRPPRLRPPTLDGPRPAGCEGRAGRSCGAGC